MNGPRTSPRGPAVISPATCALRGVHLLERELREALCHAWAMMADLILVVHFLIVLFIVSGPFGVDRRRSRMALGAQSWFRYLHLGAIAFVAAEALLGVMCPLTVWEDALRGGVRAESFVGRWVRYFLTTRRRNGSSRSPTSLGLWLRWRHYDSFRPGKELPEYLLADLRIGERHIVHRTGEREHGDVGPSERDQREMWRQSRTMSASSECMESTGQRMSRPRCTCACASAIAPSQP